MKPNKLIYILPVLSTLALVGCEGPGGMVDSAPVVVSSDFALSYGNGYGGPGYYYGPPGRGYYARGAGVQYYQTRNHVPSHYWGQWHGDRRYYGGPASVRSGSYHQGNTRPPGYRD